MCDPTYVDHFLYRSDIFDDLIDFEKFKFIVTVNAMDIAADFGCDITLVHRKLRNMHDAFIGDRKRAIDHGSKGAMNELDHLKEAAFFCFWFRRTGPIGEVSFVAEASPIAPETGTVFTPDKKLFTLYADELCGFLIAFRIIMYFEKNVHGNGESLAKLRAQSTDEHLAVFDNLSEICAMLKNKNMSPHAIYLMFKFLCRG